MRELEQILKSIAQNVFLSNKEKKEMRAGIESYAAFHSVRKESPERLHTQGSYMRSVLNLWGGGLTSKASATFFYSLLFLRKKTMPIVLILALLFGGGGVSYAAENALPGDALYTVKIGVNEEVRGLVAFTPEAKADWESRRVERRLEEAENLVAEDALSPALQGFIEEEIAEHVEKVETHLAKVEEKKDIARASEISSNLETVLRVHGEVFVKIKEKKAQKIAMATATAAGTEAVTADASIALVQSSSDDRLDDFSAKLAEKAEKIAARNETHLGTIAFEDAPGRKVSAESQAKSAEKHLAETARLYDERKAEMTDEIRAEFEKRIADARAVFEKGNEALRSENYGEAFLLFQEARSLAQKLTIFFRSENKLGAEDSDVNFFTKSLTRIGEPVAVGAPQAASESGTIAAPQHEITLYKKSPSENTRKEVAEEMLQKAGVLLEEVRQSLEKHRALLPDDVWGRIKMQVADAENLIVKGKRAFEAGEYGTAYLAAQKIINVIKEVKQIISKYADSSNTTNAPELGRARKAAEDALIKAKQAFASSNNAPEEITRKAKSLYEEATFVFSKGERAAKEGDAKEAIELFMKTVRIVEEILRVLGGTANIKPYPIEPTPTPVPKPVACTKEYAPVCASVETGVVCIKAPCPTTAEKTYGNTCEANVAGAKILYKGECRIQETEDKEETTATQCDYAAPPSRCNYEKGPKYNPTTGCGMVLACVSVAPEPTKTEILPVKTEFVPATTNTTETKTEDSVKTEAARYY